ncbi:histidine kinase [Dysgonomonas sp. ZJ709]|uniref:histidine kinase n=1 Tax=Dysgonomonas sp. ZJ709 TaxID=2709797 RepID=UPI0013EE1343|nr:histidine kinase [Dysgonomonas sp. ZJ709]
MATTIILILIIIGFISIVIYLWLRLQRLEKQKKYVENRLNTIQKGNNDIHLGTIETVLNPHLFKNILNSVQSHAYQTYFALDKLANILDYILYESKNRYVTPKEEIEFAKDLIEVNRIKLSPLFELTIKTKIDETASLYAQKVLAPLITIDLIENAFKHADLQSKDAYISIVFGFKDNVFTVTVSNKISPKASLKKEKSGIGNVTFEQRLDILYKGCYELERIIDDDAFIAHLKINLNEYKTKMLDSGR